MKVLMINGSPHLHGTTRRALDEVIGMLDAADIQSEVMTVGH